MTIVEMSARGIKVWAARRGNRRRLDLVAVEDADPGEGTGVGGKGEGNDSPRTVDNCRPRDGSGVIDS